MIKTLFLTILISFNASAMISTAVFDELFPHVSDVLGKTGWGAKEIENKIKDILLEDYRNICLDGQKNSRASDLDLDIRLYSQRSLGDKATGENVIRYNAVVSLKNSIFIQESFDQYFITVSYDEELDQLFVDYVNESGENASMNCF